MQNIKIESRRELVIGSTVYRNFVRFILTRQPTACLTTVTLCSWVGSGSQANIVNLMVSTFIQCDGPVSLAVAKLLPD